MVVTEKTGTGLEPESEPEPDWKKKKLEWNSKMVILSGSFDSSSSGGIRG